MGMPVVSQGASSERLQSYGWVGSRLSMSCATLTSAVRPRAYPSAQEGQTRYAMPALSTGAEEEVGACELRLR